MIFAFSNTISVFFVFFNRTEGGRNGKRSRDRTFFNSQLNTRHVLEKENDTLKTDLIE